MSIENPWLAGGRSIRAVSLWGVATLLVGLVLRIVLDGGAAEDGLVVAGFFGGFLLSIAGICALVMRRRWRQLRAMLAEPPLAHWIYDRDQWTRHVQRSWRKMKVPPFLFFGIIASAGFGGGAVRLIDGGTRIDGSTALTILVPGLITLVIGAAVELTIRTVSGGTRPCT